MGSVAPRGASVVGLLTVALVGLAACESGGGAGRAAVGATDPSTEPTMRERAVTDVVERITSATCDREQSCGTIGPGAPFESRDACMASIRERTTKGVSASMCPGGVDRAAYAECLESLEAGQCNAPGQAIVRSAHCSASDLCIR